MTATTFVPCLLLVDMGIPMIFFTLPAMGILLVPIILLEAWLCHTMLGLKFWTSLKANAVSNLASALLGLPVAWFIMLGLEYVTFAALADNPMVHHLVVAESPIARVIGTILSSAWLGPDEKNLYWMIPLASIILLIPTFLVSVIIERWIVARLVALPEESEGNLRSSRVGKAVQNANLVSYGLLLVGTSVWLLLSIARPPK